MRQTKRKITPKLARRKARHIGRKPETQSIVVKAPQQLQPWVVSPDEVAILKNAICKGASDEEMKYCLTVARRYQLDPFQQQIWFVPRWDAKAQTTDGKAGATVYAPVVGINGMLHIAARDHADFGSYSEPEYGPMIEVQWSDPFNKRSGKIKAPEWCRIEARKKGCSEPTVAKVWWEEIYPDVGRSPLVRRMPRLMLAKCAKAQATRTAYPKTGGLLIQEETQTREFQDITPGRRVIEHVDAAEKRYLEREDEALKKLNPAQREVLEKKMAEAKAKVSQAQVGASSPPANTAAAVQEIEPPAAAADYDGLTCTLTNGMYHIDGPTSRLREVREVLKPFWMSHAKPPGIFAKPGDFGKLCRKFEEASVKF